MNTHVAQGIPPSPVSLKVPVSRSLFAVSAIGHLPSELLNARACHGYLISTILAGAYALAYLFSRHAMLDDAYISLRYAANFADGQGLVYNIGEYVEGYTTFLWVVVLGWLIRLGADPVATCRALAVTSCVAMVTVTALWARSLRVRFWGVAGVITAIYPGTALWALNGMETCLFVTCIMLALWASTVGRIVLASALAGLCFWLRPDGGIVGAAILSAAILRQPGKRETWTAVIAWAVCVLALTAWRLWYYGQPVPNTFYAKVGDVPFALTVHYFSRFVLGAGGVLVLASLLKRQRLEIYTFAALLIAYIAAVGGDVFPGSRFFLPLVPLCAIAVTDALKTRRLAATVAILTVIVLSLLGFADVRSCAGDYSDMEARQRADAKQTPANATVARVAIGLYGYYRRDVRVLDMVGLISPQVARSWANVDGIKWPGHQRSNADWILSQRPDLVWAGDVPLPANIEMRRALEGRIDYREIRPGVWQRICDTVE